MLVKNLFEKEAHDEILHRIHYLTPVSYGHWGKMNVAQMLVHCQEAFKIPLSSKPHKLTLFGFLIGWAMRKKLYDDQPWDKNLPTAPNFRIHGEYKFEPERDKLVSMINSFYEKGTAGIGDKVHPVFGKFTAEQWGKSMWKHLDHHLRQFGV